MHDGYIFTLGICGTASAAGPAPGLLDAMLAALPPVKRAALLGEVLPLDAAGAPHDALQAAVAADLADAEVLLIVTPLVGGQLPPRLAAMLAGAAGSARGAYAALVVLGAGPDVEPPGMRDLRDLCAEAGVVVAVEHSLPADVAPSDTILSQVRAAAAHAYARARARHPQALPRDEG